jgi:hypothetical protein
MPCLHSGVEQLEAMCAATSELLLTPASRSKIRHKDELCLRRHGNTLNEEGIALEVRYLTVR